MVSQGVWTRQGLRVAVAWQAQPREEKFADSLWFMSLRDSWCRYIPLGSIFSGLFCKVCSASPPTDTISICALICVTTRHALQNPP